jgi:hypothetical protein
MGNMFSEAEYFKFNEDINNSFDDFIKRNCIQGDNQYAQYVTLESAYYYFIKINYPDFHKMLLTSSSLYAKRMIIKMCTNRGFEMSPGIIDGLLDTRHVVGVSVVQFKEKK